MKAFEYASPTTKEQAVSLLGNQWGETEILAGGTDLLSLMKEYLSSPKRVVNIKEIKELQGIRYSPGAGLRLGALVTLEELMDHATVKKEYPALAQAAEGVRPLRRRQEIQRRAARPVAEEVFRRRAGGRAVWLFERAPDG